MRPPQNSLPFPHPLPETISRTLEVSKNRRASPPKDSPNPPEPPYKDFGTSPSSAQIRQMGLSTVLSVYQTRLLPGPPEPISRIFEVWKIRRRGIVVGFWGGPPPPCFAPNFVKNCESGSRLADRKHSHEQYTVIWQVCRVYKVGRGHGLRVSRHIFFESSDVFGKTSGNV